MRYEGGVMAITDLYTVKLVGNLYDTIGAGEPTSATVGTLGDIYMDSGTGLTYECTDDSDPYVWDDYTVNDPQINLYIPKAENDYLKIRSKPFYLDSSDAIVYPDGSTLVAAEMVCFMLSIGDYEGRGLKSEGISDRSRSYGKKLMGYPTDIVGSIKRYVSP